MWKSFLSAGFALFLTGCTQIKVFAVNLPVSFADDKKILDIPYGDNPVQKADLYLPDHIPAKGAPVIAFFYGGGWTSGSKSTYPFLAKAFTEKGYAVYIPDYSKYPPAKFPVFIDDGALAVQYLYKNAKNYGINKNRIAVAGHSAGAHLGAFVAYDPARLPTSLQEKNPVRAFVGLAGPYHFTPSEKPYTEIFAPPENYPLLQISRYISAQPSPALLIHGEQDETVALANTVTFAKALKEKGGIAETTFYQGIDHIGAISAFSEYFGNAEIRMQVFDFLDKHL
jgi:acetyl esterase/lipase